MKMERINDNQIRFTLNKSDLVEREIKISELAYGSEKAQELFRDMMEQAFDEYGFETNNIPLMIEAVPLSTESIMVIVTKVDEPDEIEEKLASLTSNKKIRKFKKKSMNTNTEKDIDIKKTSKNERNKIYIYTFKTLDQIIDASSHIPVSFNNPNSIYKDITKKRYYLVINGHLVNKNFDSIDNVLLEYGQKIKSSNLAEGFLREHAEILIKNTALQILKDKLS